MKYSLRVETHTNYSYESLVPGVDPPASHTTIEESKYSIDVEHGALEDYVEYTPINTKRNSRGKMSYTKGKRTGDMTTTMDASRNVISYRGGTHTTLPKTQVDTVGFNRRTRTYTRHYSGFPNRASNSSIGLVLLPEDEPKIGAAPSQEGDDFDIMAHLPRQEIGLLTMFRRRAREDFSAKLTNMATFNGPLFAAELHKTIALVRKPADFAISKYKKWGQETQKQHARLFNGKQGIRYVKRQAEYLADKYLEIQYGVKPLLMDIEDAIETAKLKVLDANEKVVHMNRKDKFYPEDQVLLQGQYGCQARFDLVVSEELKYAGAIQHETDDNLSNLLRSVGVMPSQLPQTLLELTPFSFVVGYFANINNLLSYSPTASSRIRFCSLTVATKQSWDGVLLWPNEVNTTNYERLGRTEDGWLICDLTTIRRSTDPMIGQLLIPHPRVPTAIQQLNLGVLAASLTFKRVRASN